MRDLPITLLRTFVMVAETLNLTVAAGRLHRAPSTISMQLSRLEELVTTTLLERGQYGVRLTPAGEQLRSHAQQLLNLHDRILGSFQNADIDGKVRFGTHDQYATRSLTPLLEAFVLNYPEARLEVFCDHRPHHLLSLLREGKLDLALVEMPVLSDGGLRLDRDELVWVRSHTHMTHLRDPLPLAVFVDGCYHRDSACQALEKMGLPYRIAFTSQSRAGVLAAVRAGIGVGVIPRKTVEPDMVVVEQGLPPLPKTNTSLFIADQVNEATTRLAQTIEQSPQFTHTTTEHLVDMATEPCE
ncbi:LysR family transcriptional regulator [Oceanisphaera arctica]|uniref:LysR family transcriptional regulator n=1 Tax=Oceanisphaera arctica TaxID=641510 RepID=A0A2P5TJ82_9GAMM|nr:LysR family transcriptional regulator [Oceanisphaera arctica]PPL14930.1 LysR family transcriptional regulator [Oceanisphaera arctica]GHA22777.1 LysR family transcriptional regulator [Oceanisphaera arctica]